jgi:molybdopterin converting factor small subunit
MGVRSHGVSWDNPRALTELMGDCEFVVVLFGLRVEAESNEGKTLTALFRHYNEAELFKGVRKVVGGAGEVAHDGTVTVLTETDELVILSNDLGGTL